MFRLPTKVDTSPGCARKLPDLIASSGAERVMVLTDEGVQMTDWFAPLIAACGSVRVESAISANPRATEVDSIADRARAYGADYVVGIGGGSVLDAAKAIAMLLRNEGGIADFEGKNRFRGGSTPFVAIPTTCGTGSEVTWVSVISTPENGRKISVKGDDMFPTFALSDADLIRTLPPHLIASTGMDAMTHALEAMAVRVANPVSDALATRAVFLLMDSLSKCVADPEDHFARRNVMLASTLAGMAFGNADVGAVHCLSESIGGLLDLPHGLLNTLLLVPVFSYQKDAVAPVLSSKLHIPFEKLFERVQILVDSLPLTSWHDLKIDSSSYQVIGAGAENNGSNESNRMALKTQDYVSILEIMSA